MRKSKRFIKKFSERFIVYIVVFVAFVNACFFAPMEVHASSSFSRYYYNTYLSTTSDLLLGPSDSPSVVARVFTNTYTPSISTDISVTEPFTITVSSDDFSDGNYFVYKAHLFFYTGNVDSLEVVGLVPTFTVFDPAYSVSGDTADTGSPNYDISFSSYGSQGSQSTYYNYFIMVSGSYNDIYKIGFSFKLKFNLSISSPVSSVYVSTQMLEESLEIYGSDVSDSQNLQDLVDGYNDSTGNQVSSDFESGVNDYDQAEDNLFNTSTGALQGFEFFDFGSFSSVTSGLSFCSSLLTSIYENFGGLNGIGIVISVLFSVLFMAIVIGLFRYYK